MICGGGPFSKLAFSPLLCVAQNLVKKNLKNKQQRAGEEKAETAVAVAKVTRPKVESKNGGERPFDLPRHTSVS